MNIAVLGGGGYVGSALVPALLAQGHYVRVLDTFYYGKHLPNARMGVFDHIKCDMRQMDAVWLEGCDTLIHLACVSNDPSFALNPLFAASVNGIETFSNVLDAAYVAGIKRIIYASSSSIYGVRPDGEAVHEETACNPLTDYSRMKLECERVLTETDFDWTILRPATVCGWAPRLRLDVVVNAMTASALQKGVIPVYGGPQRRSNIYIEDMVRAYQTVLENPKSLRCTFNVGAENLSLNEIAERISEMTGVEVVHFPTNDPRSYTIDSSWIKQQVGFEPAYAIEDAIHSIRKNLWHGLHTVNISRLKELLDAGKI